MHNSTKPHIQKENFLLSNEKLLKKVESCPMHMKFFLESFPATTFRERLHLSIQIQMHIYTYIVIKHPKFKINYLEEYYVEGTPLL